jgi:hypothetical protein
LGIAYKFMHGLFDAFHSALVQPKGSAHRWLVEDACGSLGGPWWALGVASSARMALLAEAGKRCTGGVGGSVGEGQLGQQVESLEALTASPP